MKGKANDLYADYFGGVRRFGYFNVQLVGHGKTTDQRSLVNGGNATETPIRFNSEFG